MTSASPLKADIQRTSREGRGRDEDCSSPPAQIPAGAANAPGSSLGSNVGGAHGLKPHALRRTAANRVDVAARLSVRTTAACRLFPLGEALPSTTSAGSCLTLFSRFAGSMASSDFSSTYMLGVRLLAFPSRPGTRVRAWMRPPRFRAKNFSTCTRSPTARGSSHASHSPWDDVAFSSTERDRHLGIRPVSQLNTWPVVSPVNASRRPSRDAAHHSGSGWLARPSPWGTFTSYSLPASWRTPHRVNRYRNGLFVRRPLSPR